MNMTVIPIVVCAYGRVLNGLKKKTVGRVETIKITTLRKAVQLCKYWRGPLILKLNEKRAAKKNSQE